MYLQCATKEKSECDHVQRKRLREVEYPSSPSKQQATVNWVSNSMSAQRTHDIHNLLLQSIMYGGISFSIGRNMFFNQFVQALSSSYRVPTRNMLSGHVLTNMFSKHLQKKLSYLPTLVDFTICAYGWTDESGNSICAFMILKEESEDVLDIIDLSDLYTKAELKVQLLSKLLMNSVSVDNAVACVYDSPSTMVQVRNDLHLKHPNILSILCCQHAFSMLAKDIVGFSEVISVSKHNQKLVNYFTSSHFWRKTLIKWQEEKKLPHFLNTFCETRWYSLSRVCLGVAAYKEGFRYCLELSKRPEYPNITNMEVHNIIEDRQHFAANDCLVEALNPVVSVIGMLKKRTATLADVLWGFIMIYYNAKKSDFAIQGLKEHVLCAIGKRAKDFEDPIYFIALFLHPPYKKMAMSGNMTDDKIIRAALETAKVWHFSKHEVGLLFKELVNYKNGDAPFDDLKESSNRCARDFWEKFNGASLLLRQFATKVYAIVPHCGPCEHLFSTLGLTKTKSGDRLDVEKLTMIAQIKCDLAREVRSKNKVCETSDANDLLVDGLSMGDFVRSAEDEVANDVLDEVIEEVHFSNSDDETMIMEDFFDFEAFEHDIARISLETKMENGVCASQDNGEWSIDDIIKEFS